jgi:hypothetical protein
VNPVWVRVATDALSTAAVAHHSPAALIRGGPMQRAANLVERGLPEAEAAAIAARQGKGHVAEVQQAADYSVGSGAHGRPYRARPSRRANDPRVDVELRKRGSRRRQGVAQMKVGKPRYVLQAFSSGRYDQLVVNCEAAEVIARDQGIDLADRLGFRGNEAAQVSAERCEEQAADSIVRVLLGELPFGWLDQVVAYARAGLRAGLESFAACMLGDLVDAMWSGRPLDLGAATRAAAQSAGRSAARAAVHSHLLVREFLAKARQQFSDRLLHRIAGSTVMLGAIAEVLVETTIDVVRVLRGEMTFDELLRSFGVHVCTAAGGAIGIAVAGLLTGGAVWWVQGLAMLLGGAAGAYCGRSAGVALFHPPALPAAPFPVR